MAESKLERQWVEIFRAGNYGDKGRYSPSDLDQVVADYDPAFHEAPVVIGRPETNAPAFGWVGQLKRVGDRLLAKLKQVNPAFEQMVAEGKFKTRSASFYRRPGALSLRHVGFLGAQPPDVKGLADVKFEEGTATAEITFEGSPTVKTNSAGGFFAQRSIPILTFSEDGSNDEGQWLKIFSAGDSWGDNKLTTEDLDSIVSSYKPGQASVGVGALAGGAIDNAPRHGEVAAVRRDGKDLLAKIEKADPRMVDLNKAGAFKKLSVSLKKTPAGLSLQRVAFVAPHYVNGAMSDSGGLDDIHSRQAETKNVVFNENLSALRVAPGRLRVDPNSVKLCDLAKQRAREGSISFAEALTEVAGEHPELTATPARVAISPNSVKLSDLAKQRAREGSVSFAEALTEVAGEHPELTATPARVAISPNSVKLSDLAKQRAREGSVSFAEALTEVAGEHPELTW